MSKNPRLTIEESLSNLRIEREKLVSELSKLTSDGHKLTLEKFEKEKSLIAVLNQITAYEHAQALQEIQKAPKK